MTTQMDGAHVVVMGGSSGIGYAVAHHAIRSGAMVTITGRCPSKLQTAADRLEGARTIVSDISSRQSVEAVFENLPNVHHLVITAGQRILGKLSEHDPEYLLEAVRERLFGAVYAIRAALPLLHKNSSITLTSGLLATRPTALGTAVIAAACGGVEALARGLALELAPIRVNAVAPGVTETGLLDSLGSEYKRNFFDKASAALPVRRIGTPADIASAISFLMTNGYTTGQVLRIDGGGALI